MAVVSASDSLHMDGSGLLRSLTGWDRILQASATGFIVQDDAGSIGNVPQYVTYSVTGSFDYAGGQVPVAGVITGAELSAFAGHHTVSGMQLDLATFYEYANAFNLDALDAVILAGDDSIVGSNDPFGFAGSGLVDDYLIGYGGDDIVKGRGGDDVLEGGAGRDTLVGGADSDTLRGGAGDDSLAAAGGNDVCNAAGGADALLGGGGNDNLRGGGGTDTLRGGAGDDSLTGGTDADVYSYTAAALNSADVLAGDADTIVGDSADCIDVADALAALLTVEGAVIGDGDTLGGTINGSNNIAFDDATDLLMIDVNGGGFGAAEDFSIDLVGVASVTYHASTSTFSFTLDP